MHYKTKERFITLKESGLTAEELKAEMLQKEVSEQEADELIEELYNPESAVHAKNTTAGKDTKKQKAAAGQATHEEWKMSRTIDSEGKIVLEKNKKIKDVKIDDNRAARLNEHSNNNLTKYFKK